MKKKNAIAATAASIFFITMLGVILFALKKSKGVHQHDSLYTDLSGDKSNLDSESSLSLHEKIEQKINEAATKITNPGNNFSMPVGEFGTFL
ncbi:MAG: hypothetical protein ABI091_08835 [Ferruginibacter sp.]